MKYLLLPILLFFTTNAFAQSQDLIALAQGDFLGMNPLFQEDGSLFGYISIYDQGKSGPKTKKFEYVILDKNLNPFANNTFDGDITAGDYWGYINFDGSIILKPSRLDLSLVESDERFSPWSMVINLKDNTIKKKTYYEYEEGAFKEVTEQKSWKENKQEYKAEKKEKGYVENSSLTEIKQGGYLVHTFKNQKGHIKDNQILRFDKNRELMWSYEYNKNSSKSAWETLYYLDDDEQYFYGFIYKRHTSNMSGVYAELTYDDNPMQLLVLDIKTGKEVHRKPIKDPEHLIPSILKLYSYGFGSVSNYNDNDDEITMIFKYGSGLFGRGFSKLSISKKNFDVTLNKISYKDDFKNHLPKINRYGMVEKSYYLDIRDVFFLNEGNIGLLFEKYKPATQYTATKTTDMVYVQLDKDLKITGTKTFVKQKSKWYSDYLFSQKLNNKKDIVFFYRDYQKDGETKDKNWNLFINTYIDNKFKQEMVPISAKKDYFILPYIAKEGYILLQEFNKKAKYNQVRLERLNY